MGGEQSKISHEEDELKLNVDLLLPGEATPGLPSLKDKIVLSERVSKQSFFRAVEEQKTKSEELILPLSLFDALEGVDNCISKSQAEKILSGKIHENLYFTSLELLDTLNELPTYRKNRKSLTKLNNIVKMDSLIIFISHNFDNNSSKNKLKQEFELIKSGCTALFDRYKGELKYCYLYYDKLASSVDVHASHLAVAIGLSDCTLTPISDDINSIKINSNNNTINSNSNSNSNTGKYDGNINYLYDYISPSFSQNSNSYLKKRITKIEMWYSALLPVTVNSNPHRLAKLRGDLLVMMCTTGRPHFIYDLNDMKVRKELEQKRNRDMNINYKNSNNNINSSSSNSSSSSSNSSSSSSSSSSSRWGINQSSKSTKLDNNIDSDIKNLADPLNATDYLHSNGTQKHASDESIGYPRLLPYLEGSRHRIDFNPFPVAPINADGKTTSMPPRNALLDTLTDDLRMYEYNDGMRVRYDVEASDYDDAGIIQGSGRVLFESGAIYTGNFKNNLFHGFGKLVLNNGMYYTGNFHNGQINGEGKIIYGDGSSYEGQFYECKRHGQGNFISATGDLYKGEFQYDAISGQGEMLYANKNRYVGSFLSNTCHGSGIFHYSNGDVFDGLFRYNIRIGRGIMKYNNGDIYTGFWSNNLRDGQGNMQYSNGSIYDGDWCDDKRQGSGLLTHANGDSYNGTFINNLPHGVGTFQYENGDRYEGTWEHGMQSGTGIFIHHSGSKYEGGWKEGKRHGLGRFVSMDRHTYHGNYERNFMHGVGKFVWANGDYYEGSFKENQMHGRGKIVHKSGNVFVGEFKNDMKDGKGKLYNINGIIFNGFWRSGKMKVPLAHKVPIRKPVIENESVILPEESMLVSDDESEWSQPSHITPSPNFREKFPITENSYKPSVIIENPIVEPGQDTEQKDMNGFNIENEK